MTAPNDHQDRFEVRLTSDSYFSWLRTRLSVERTLMSWVRTSVSLIGFGFTIVQFFDRLASIQGVADAAHPQAPRHLGVALIAAGVLALVISVWQFRSVNRYLQSGGFHALAGLDDAPLHTPLSIVAVVLIFIAYLRSLPC